MVKDFPYTLTLRQESSKNLVYGPIDKLIFQKFLDSSFNLGFVQL